MEYTFNRCFGCMKELHGEETCPYCGYNAEKEPHTIHQLRPGTILNGAYLVGKVLGQGGFGITYIGWDLNLERTVAIKEYYPNGVVTRDVSASNTVISYPGSQGDYFAKGKSRFEKEARILSQFSGNPQIVQVQNYFQGNNTAYIIMEFLQGMTLKEYTEKCRGRIPAQEVLELMKPIIRALGKVHQTGLIHRDISPDNLMLMPNNTLKLMDFGAAHLANPEGERSVTIMLKYGYAPIEQYLTHGNIGPWTDIHALCATMYYCMTGQTPKEALERQEHDDTQLPEAVAAQLTQEQILALKKGMAVRPENRYQSMEELYNGLYAPPKEFTEEKTQKMPAPDPAPQDKKKKLIWAVCVGAAVAAVSMVLPGVLNGESSVDKGKGARIAGETDEESQGILFTAGLEEDAQAEETEAAEEETEGEIQIWTDSAGNQYEGVQVDGVLDGYGTCLYAENENGLEEYVGEWNHGIREGDGTLTWTDGAIYEGEWKNDSRHGEGIQIEADGSTYEGHWENSQRSGVGTMEYSSGETYSGDWEEDVRSGFGVYTWPDGDSYEGYWEDGEQNGLGTYTWSDGDVYLGEWANGERNGNGTMYYADGTTVEGIWEDGTMVEELSHEEPSSAADMDSSDYIFPESDSRYLLRTELEGLSAETLRLGRNEIYARHGRKFLDPQLQAYFDSKPWYEGTIEPEDFDDDTYLNSYEKENRDLISEYEKEMGN